MAQIGTLTGLYGRGNVPSVSIKDEVLAGRLLASSKFSVVITVIICVPWNSFCSVIREICFCLAVMSSDANATQLHKAYSQSDANELL